MATRAYSVKSNHLLIDGSRVTYKASPNTGGALKPLYLVMHYTAGISADGAISWFANKDASASAHLVIDRDGSVTQMVPFNTVAWHAGRSSWNDLVGMNQFSIGIELVNAGKLSRNEASEWANWSRKKIPNGEVIVAQHKHELSPAGWHVFTEKQISAATDVGISLNKEFGFVDVLGHDDISPMRKVDPGPAFPMLSVSSKILGRQ